MLTSRLGRLGAPCFSTFVLAVLAVSSAVVHAQVEGPPTPDSIVYKVDQANERLELTVNTSRILTLDDKIPRFVVNDPDKVKVTPISATQLQVVALKPGVTQVNLWTDKKRVHSIDIIVFGDARELAMVLENEFPSASLKVRPLSQNVIISGYVDRPDHVSRIHRIAEEYYPNVIDNITVGGVQQVQLHCKLMEVSRTKLRRMGFDFSAQDFLLSTGTGAVSGGLEFGIVSSGSSFSGYLDLLRKYNLLKLLSEPTLVTVSGRPAFVESGGDIPVVTSVDRDGNSVVEYRPYGTRLDFVPIVLGNGNIRLEVRSRISEIDPTRADDGGLAFLRREVDTGVELKAGQTLALAGLLQHRVESEDQGIPWLADLPWFGAAFRRKQEKINEIELLVLVTPELVDGMNPEEVPPCGPGMSTTSPCDVDFYFRGYMEVPHHRLGAPYDDGGIYEEVPAEAIPSTPSEGDTAPLPALESNTRYDGNNSQESTPRASQPVGEYHDRTYSDSAYNNGAYPKRDHSARNYRSDEPIERLQSRTTDRRSDRSRYNQYDPGNRDNRRADHRYNDRSAASVLEDAPGLVGPIGYDR